MELLKSFVSLGHQPQDSLLASDAQRHSISTVSIVVAPAAAQFGALFVFTLHFFLLVRNCFRHLLVQVLAQKLLQHFAGKLAPELAKKVASCDLLSRTVLCGLSLLVWSLY